MLDAVHYLVSCIFPITVGKPSGIQRKQIST